MSAFERDLVRLLSNRANAEEVRHDLRVHPNVQAREYIHRMNLPAKQDGFLNIVVAGLADDKGWLTIASRLRENGEGALASRIEAQVQLYYSQSVASSSTSGVSSSSTTSTTSGSDSTPSAASPISGS